jgi:proline racemase
MNGGVHVPFVIDNPDDTVTRVLNVEGDVDHCSIELAMPPALVLADPLDDAETGDLAPALASCGNTFLIVPASSAGVPALREAEAETLKQIALCIHESAPSVTRKRSDGLQILLYEEQPGEPRTFATFVLFNGTQIDRSPCGTGSAALSALLVARGAIAAGEPIRTVGPAGEFFEVEACPRPGDGAPLYDARLRGTAHIIGVHQWIFSAEDRLAQGYLLA